MLSFHYIVLYYPYDTCNSWGLRYHAHSEFNNKLCSHLWKQKSTQFQCWWEIYGAYCVVMMNGEDTCTSPPSCGIHMQFLIQSLKFSPNACNTSENTKPLDTNFFIARLAAILDFKMAAIYSVFRRVIIGITSLFVNQI